MSEWTAQDVASAIAWRQEEFTDQKISEKLDGRHSASAIRKKIRRLGGYEPTGTRHRNKKDAPPPPEVIAERDRAYGCQPTVGMLLFGDPPPGRSAAERRGA